MALWVILEKRHLEGMEDIPLGCHDREKNSTERHLIYFCKLKWSESIADPSCPSKICVSRSDRQELVAAHGIKFEMETEYLLLDLLDTYMLDDHNA